MWVLLLLFNYSVVSDFLQPHVLQHGEGNGNPLQYSCLENPMDRGAWWAAVCGVTQSRTRLKRLSISTATCQASLSFTIFWSLLKLVSIDLVMSSNYLILCRPLLFLPSILASIRVFSNESALHIGWWVMCIVFKYTKYWNFSFSISPSSEYSGLISFRINWFDPLAIQGTFKSLLQHHSSKA